VVQRAGGRTSYGRHYTFLRVDLRVLVPAGTHNITVPTWYSYGTVEEGIGQLIAHAEPGIFGGDHQTDLWRTSSIFKTSIAQRTADTLPSQNPKNKEQ
jgi:hypothetical protein